MVAPIVGQTVLPSSSDTFKSQKLFVRMSLVACGYERELIKDSSGRISGERFSFTKHNRKVVICEVTFSGNRIAKCAVQYDREEVNRAVEILGLFVGTDLKTQLGLELMVLGRTSSSGFMNSTGCPIEVRRFNKKNSFLLLPENFAKVEA